MSGSGKGCVAKRRWEQDAVRRVKGQMKVTRGKV